MKDIIYNSINNIMTYYYNIINYFLFIKSNNIPLLFKIYIYYYLSYELSNIINKENEYINIELNINNISRNIVLENKNIKELTNDIKNISNNKEIFNTNNIIVLRKIPVLDIYYEDNNQKKSLKKIFDKYIDNNLDFKNNTINNILELNNIININIIKVTYLKNFKKITKDFLINKENPIHINQLYTYE